MHWQQKPAVSTRRMFLNCINVSLATKLRLPNSSTRQVIVLNPRLAVQADGKRVRNVLLLGAAVLDGSETKLKAASNRMSVLASNIPGKLYTLESLVPVTSETMIEEAAPSSH